MGEWSPDGNHVVVDTSGGAKIIDRLGNAVQHIDASSIGWLNDATIAAFGASGPGPGTGSIRFITTDGDEIGRIDAEYAGMVVSPGNNLLAAVWPPDDSQVIAFSYRIWENDVLSASRDGHPLSWSPDGSILAVLMSAEADTRATEEGTLTLVNRSGERLLSVPGWTAIARYRYEFSPNGSQIAACLWDPADMRTPPSLRVVNAETGSVSDAVGECSYFSWGEGTTLYASGAGQPARVWTPEGGVRELGGADDQFVTPSSTGLVAVWSPGTPESTLRVRAGDAVAEYQLPMLRQVAWSPDGELVAAISSDGLTLISAPDLP